MPREIEYGSSEDEKARLLQQLHMTGLEYEGVKKTIIATSCWNVERTRM